MFSEITPLKSSESVFVWKSRVVPIILLKNSFEFSTIMANEPRHVTGTGTLKVGSMMLNGIKPNFAFIDTALFTK